MLQPNFVGEAMNHALTSYPRIGALLVEKGKLNTDDTGKILEFQRKSSLLFGEAAVQLNLVRRKDIEQALATQFAYPYIDIDKIQLDNDVVVAHKPFSPEADAIRHIRTQIMLQWNTNVHPSMAVVSASRGEGRSYFAANLAVSISQLGKKTLLIDADLRAARMHSMFGLPSQSGLSTMLAHTQASDSALDMEHIPGLSILSSGPLPPNPMELISSDRMRSLIDAYKTHFDVIVIDTPAYETNADADILASLAGSAVIVARQDKTQIDKAKTVVDQLKKLKVNIIGSVLNTY